MQTVKQESDAADLSNEDRARRYDDWRLEELHQRHISQSDTESRPSGYREGASDLTMRLPQGTLNIPGWIRHACGDVFFDSYGDVDAPSIPEAILNCLLKVRVNVFH